MKTIAALALATLGFALASTQGGAAVLGPAIDINGTDVTSALNCSAAGTLTTCEGAGFSTAGYSLDAWQLFFDQDPSLNGSFTLTNLSPNVQPFILTVSLFVPPIASPISVNGSLGAGKLTDANGGGAELKTVAPIALYTARIDGSPVHTLLDDPQDFVVPIGPTGGGGGSVSIGPASFGPNVLAQSINSLIGTAFEFTLTAGDTVFLPFTFSADPINSNPVPEPATFALVAIGFAGFGFSRRKRTT